jgi:peptidoglycan-N-acetylglucosamine deacetylase
MSLATLPRAKNRSRVRAIAQWGTLFSTFFWTPVSLPEQQPAPGKPAEARQELLERRVAITIDDLPAGAAQNMAGSEVVAMTQKLLATLKQRGVPAVGFVNEHKLYYKPEQVTEFVHALSLWVENGFELGNHTFAHTSLNRVPLKDWEEAVIQGEPVTRMLDARYGMRLRFFRHPYLDVGRDLTIRREAERFLTDRGYHIAPVTLDPWDWYVAGLYEYARRNGDTATEQQVVSAWLVYSAEAFDSAEKLSRDLVGREPKQILLLHGNWLEADHIGDLLGLLEKRGYRFIPLSDALEDSIYSMPSDYVGEQGASWLEQLLITRGQTPRGGAEYPQAILDKIKAMPRQAQVPPWPPDPARKPNP